MTEHVPLPELPIEDEERPQTGKHASTRNVAFGGDGTLVVSSGSHILLWAANHLPRQFGDDVSDLAFGENDRLLESGDTGRLTTWTTPDLRHLTDRELLGTGSDEVTGVFSADGTRLAVAAPKQPLSVWDTSGRDAVVLTTPGWPNPAVPSMMAVATDPPAVLVVDEPRQRPFVLRDVRHLGEETVVQEDSYLVTSAAFLRGSALIALGLLNGDVKIKDSLTGNEVTVLYEHSEPVTAIAATRDGRMLATGGVDGTIILWDTTTHARWAILTGQPGPIAALAWKPDGSVLASAGAQSTITLWRVDMDSAIRTVCDRLAGVEGQSKEPLPPKCPKPH
jgi:WD40 repeat protein